VTIDRLRDSKQMRDECHFPSPVQRVPPIWAAPKIRVPVHLPGWAKTKFRTEPLHFTLRIPVQVGHQFQNQWGTIPFGVGHLTEDRKPFLALNIRVGGGSGETK
jgi:hypothetical protein